MVTSDFGPLVEIWPLRACAMHLAKIIRTVRSLWNWLWGRYHNSCRKKTGDKITLVLTKVNFS